MSAKSRRYNRGFSAVSGLIGNQVRDAGKKRGFAVMRMVTHWDEIVGHDIAQMAQPVDVGYSRDGFGACLTVLCTGSSAPIVQTMLPQIKDRVNGCYGYNAISRVRITQTAPVGFMRKAPMSEQTKPAPPPEAVAASEDLTRVVADDTLKKALARLGANVLAKNT